MSTFTVRTKLLRKQNNVRRFQWIKTHEDWTIEHHMITTESQLVGQEFLLMEENDLKNTCKLCQRYIKSKEEQHIL